MDETEGKPAPMWPLSPASPGVVGRDAELEWQVELGQEILERFSATFELLAK
ncbi:hypothetical protein [uncultured Caulobacter sp.]|uniref:hypothetical protein n=1 Tax=uncultured Caulobacter sp. TaxID=158749 RepID=UPI002618A3AE|nr:hypothetical protein [uncultured Caulobacter sp.]